MLTTIQKLLPQLRNRHSEFAPALQMKTILYVEDDEHDIFFLARAFSMQAPDLRIENVTSVADAVEYLSGKNQFSDREEYPLPDLVVSDVSIPGGSGFELVRWIRQNPQLKKTPVILLTGTAEQLQVEKAESTGAECCLEKSSDFQQLLAKIRKFLNLD